MNLNNLVAIARSYKGRVTYSMTGSRNMSDGTADCSGFISTILHQARAGGAFNGQLFSTVTLPNALPTAGFRRIVVDSPNGWVDLAGDIVIWSDGTGTADSGGAGGHVMLMTGSDNEISCDWSTQGQAGTAVEEYNYDKYYSWNNPNYYEVWRYTAPTPAPTPAPAPTPKPKGEDNMYLVQLTTALNLNGVTFASGACFALTATHINHIPNPNDLEALTKLTGKQLQQFTGPELLSIIQGLNLGGM